MFDLLFIPVAILYLLVVGALFIYGVNFFYLTYVSLRRSPEDHSLTALGDLPRVTVQLPVYNEMYVANRLISSAANLDYPAQRLEIQVLDDSTDETRTLISRKVAALKRQGINIHHIHRQNRTGYKAGALGNGLKTAQGEFIAIFDADFIPSSDFLHCTLPCFSDPDIAFVQTRWGHTNRDYSLITLLQSLAIDAHFMVEQYARSRAGLWFNFNGTAGIWRKSAMLDAGGWKADTLTEDLDLSYRAFFRGWKARYLRDVEVPAELPVSFNAYRRQQNRWARGSLECALKFIPRVWNSPLPVRQKLQATLHLTGYCVHILLAALVFLYPLVLMVSQHYPTIVSLFGIAFFFNFTAFAPTIFFIVAERQLGRRFWSNLPQILFVSFLGAGMMVNTLRAAASIPLKKGGAFERTPKFGILPRRQSWTAHRYQLKLDSIVFPELAFALINAATVVFALKLHNWMIAIYAGIFFSGLLFTSGVTILQSLAVAYQQARAHSVQEVGR